MTTGTSVSVEEYLRTSYEPNCEYVDGMLIPKAMGTKKHGRLQKWIMSVLERAFPQYEATPEFTLRIHPKKYLIPDLAVELRDLSQDPYAITPIHLCVEILSPGDRVAEVFRKCETYHAWGTRHAWVLDPIERKAWQYTKGSEPREVDTLEAGDIRLRVADIFSVLD